MRRGNSARIYGFSRGCDHENRPAEMSRESIYILAGVVRSKGKKIFLGVALLIVAGLIVLRVKLPVIVQHYVNHKLDEIPEYDGHVGDIDIHLIHGAYTINDINIVKVDGIVQQPFFSADKVDLSIEWRELFHRAIVGKILVDKGKVNFVQGASEKESQTSIDDSWLGVVKDLFPFRINRFEIREGEVWFHDTHTEPKVDIYLTNLTAVCTNLYNTRRFQSELPADFTAKGTTIGNGLVDIHVKLDPLADDPKFDLNLSMKGMDLVALNDFLEAYGKFNVKRGTFEVFSEIAGENGGFEGYVKPFFENLDVLDLQQDSKNPIKLAWQAIVAGAVKIFKNHAEDQVATKVPISGTFQNSKVQIWTTIANVLRNAFVQAFTPKLDRSIDIFHTSEEGAKTEKSTRQQDEAKTGKRKEE
jgi:hypothetical protein